MAAVNRPAITVQIDELDLRAVPPHRRAAVADAFVRELTALISHGPATWPTDAPQAPTPAALNVYGPPHRVGALLARNVYASASTAAESATISTAAAPPAHRSTTVESGRSGGTR